ncbi:hypothetical protein EVAR_82022_1 [Eumeta japonica]|uniref:Uncharacterized protein n=1 Tax=Eumeta variegata TaxID=151549 RepID=A0A4C1XKZ4_EUMVA|nr:hypothetical protein EVAR_82022_1 [Eumeta japonica]
MPILQCVKVQRETAGLCCASGKVKLDPLLTPPQPLKTLFDGSDPDSSHFLQHILEYNNCFRMTSFGANIIREAASCRLARADCTPTGEHVRRFNAPTVNDVAAIIVGDPTKSRDIVVQRRTISCIVKRDTSFVRCVTISIIYWQGQDGYDITLKMVDPITGYQRIKSKRNELLCVSYDDSYT